MVHFFQKLREPVSGLTHLAAVFLSLEALIVLEQYAVTSGTVWHIVSFAIYGASLILLYCASAMYHLLTLSSHSLTILRRIDHAMIFILIAGTYTPVCLLPLRGIWGWSLFGVVWSMALAGIVQALFWIHAPRWLSTTLYLIMGWLVIAAFYPLVLSIPMNGIIWFILGGLCYTGGAIIYALKKPDLFPGVFGFHELWHLLVIAGSFCHFWAIYQYISPII
ncbi:MAG: hemolysin III family protein [Ignavibacteriae bacterium]|nr:MAG: hemolysin III family protein [Ignavibacteriota bacterium]